MKNSDKKFSRMDRMKKRRGDKILNILIALVAVGIIITASVIFLGGNKDQANEEDSLKNNEPVEQAEGNEEEATEEDHSLNVVEEDNEETNEPDETDESSEDEQAEEEFEDVEITVDTDDPVVSQSIVNPAWQPIGTEQTGEHVSSYTKSSPDWKEKVNAITYATGLSEDNMIIWKLKNGGSPQKSIGIISSKDRNEKYRVYLEWIDQEGWKPAKMDVLNTLDFNY